MERIARIETDIEYIKSTLSTQVNGKISHTEMNLVRLIDAKIDAINNNINELRMSVNEVSKRLDERITRTEDNLNYLRSEMIARDWKMVIFVFTVIGTILTILHHGV